MSFYTPTWIRRLVKEDHQQVYKFVNKSGNDFRDYIDGITPFVLWLDIGLIREKIISKSQALIQELADTISLEDDPSRNLTQIVTDIIDSSYIATINNFANNKAYKRISYKELESLLTSLSNAPLGSVKATIQTNFKRTVIVEETTKKDRSVMLVFPKFTTVDVGSVFKAELKNIVEKSKLLKGASSSPQVSGMFAQLAGLGKEDSEKQRFIDFIDSKFSKLQNIGHIEVDVISKEEKIVKRGQNSPRLLQALVTLPNDPKVFQRLQVKFSKETGQAQTRLKIRKKFTSSKLIFELLVENGLAVGIPETQEDNLYKAKLERAFSIGRGLSAQIRKDPGLFSELETSKSLRKYLEESIVHSIKSGKNYNQYNKTTDLNITTKIPINKISLQNVNRNPSGTSNISVRDKKKNIVKADINLGTLQNLINASLHNKIKQNMGTGTSRDILNYRTGRFAQSVQVERLTQGREGMITAYYNYMRYPYATFSAGGRQEFPRSRDPKLLISKSIREIMQEQMITRMRAVLV